MGVGKAIGILVLFVISLPLLILITAAIPTKFDEIGILMFFIFQFFNAILDRSSYYPSPSMMIRDTKGQQIAKVGSSEPMVSYSYTHKQD